MSAPERTAPAAAVHLAHHFRDPQQQHDTNVLGMWMFLATEVLFFGGVFVAYAVIRWRYPEAVAAASNLLSIPIAATNTVVLIGSSLTVVLAIHAIKLGNRKMLEVWLAATILLGLTFLGIKAYEYTLDYNEGLWVMTGSYHPTEWQEKDEAREAAGKPTMMEEYGGAGRMFLFLYYFLTGLHALHMTVGLAIFAILLYFARRRVYSSSYYTPIEVAGLYWHFVDLVWVFLFPLLYLIGRH